MRRWTYLLCGALVLGSFATMAAPEPQPYPICQGKPTEGDQRAAKSLFTAGQVSFNEADYRTAIQYWRDAYKRDCTAHLLLVNLARAYELAGDKRESVTALKLYLEREPKASDAPQIQRRIENLERDLAGPQPTATASGQHATPTPTSVGPQPTGTAAPTATGTSAPGGDAPKRSIAPWIVVGAGGALTVVGLLVYAGGKSKVSEAEDKCPTHTDCSAEDTDLGEDGRKQANVGGALTWIGVAGVAGGLVWQFAFNKPKPKPAAGLTNVGPTFGRGFTGLSLQGQF